MSLAIAGRGWVTPLGSDVAEVWRRVSAGEEAPLEMISSPESDRAYPVFRVPLQTLAVPPHPRLRRSSAISKFAAAAGVAALRDAAINLTADVAARTALVFGVSNGGVVYTKRFYHDIVEAGARAASPLLFPETVFNAPASHLAAMLGIVGASYTVVADGAVGALAIQMAHDLMQNDSLECCLVVAAEEADWLLCDAYRKWRLLRSTAPIRPFERPPRGMILSEGAGALVLARRGELAIERISPGRNFCRRAEATPVIRQVFDELCTGGEAPVVIASANGTFIDEAERRAIDRSCPQASVHTPKRALGDSVGASGIWQVICAAEALKGGEAGAAIASICGVNQQAGGVRLRLRA